MEPWFRKIPQRLDEELRALEDAGYSFELDQAAKAAGHILIKVQYPLDGQVHDLTVYFPPNYPYCPFEITAPTFPGGRHKNPNGGHLCLLKNPQTTWSVKDLLADFLKTQVAKIAEAHRNPGEAGTLEAHEAAQATGYYSYHPGTIVFTGDWQLPQEIHRGYLLLGLPAKNSNEGLRAAVLEVRDENNNVLGSLDESIRHRYPGTAICRWVRLAAPPSFEIENALLEANKVWPEVRNPRFDSGLDVVGLLFPEEVEYQRFHENWVFAVRQKIRLEKPRVHSRVANYFARADELSLRTLQARVRNLSPLFKKKVLVVGLGSIGSMYAWQLARAGIGAMDLIDFDHLQFGNSSRWLLGWQASGYDKAGVLAHYLATHYPLAKFRALPHRIGSPFSQLGRDELEILSEALEGTDLIFDATAEWCVSHYLSDLAREHGIPYLWATGTPGAYGGIIGRVVPGKTCGCWKCYQRKLSGGEILIPNHADVPDVQPVGCFHPTFVGTGFDMDHVTLGAVRLTASTLCASEQGMYPDFTWDVGVVNTWSADGVPIAPEWKTYTLERHPECDEHAAK